MGRKNPADLAGTNRARNLLQQSEKAVEDMLLAFDVMTERMRADEVSEADVSRSLTVLTRARTRLIEEVVKHENGILFAEKQVADAPIDFDELRCSIRGKLDRIRNTFRTESLS